MTATDQAKQLFEAFKALNPNCKDVFEPTLPNLQRWQWHVNESRFRPQYDKVLPGIIKTEDEKLVSARAFRTFGQMPKYMQNRFRTLAALFLGREVYATGSRVNGDWIEIDSPTHIARLRESLGKSPKLESDYDICIELFPGENRDELTAKLPPWGDLLPHGVKSEQKVLIPMWNWDKLPESEYQNAIDLFNAQRWGALMALHNKYGLSPQTLCCDDAPVRTWFEWAIKEQIIKPKK